jgi:hypothetical protein
VLEPIGAGSHAAERQQVRAHAGSIQSRQITIRLLESGKPHVTQSKGSCHNRAETYRSPETYGPGESRLDSSMQLSLEPIARRLRASKGAEDAGQARRASGAEDTFRRGAALLRNGQKPARRAAPRLLEMLHAAQQAGLCKLHLGGGESDRSIGSSSRRMIEHCLRSSEGGKKLRYPCAMAA